MKRRVLVILPEASAEFNYIEVCEKLHFDGVEGYYLELQQTLRRT